MLRRSRMAGVCGEDQLVDGYLMGTYFRLDTSLNGGQHR